MRYACTFFICNLLAISLLSQHTFSIAAVDPATGEVGSAGATCLTSADCGGCGGAVIISGLVPGVGAVNSQATVCIPNANLNVAINRMKQGDTAQEIVDFLLANDACGFGNTTDRQYGIARLDGSGGAEALGFTGSNTLAESGHLSGDNYSIQGNILINTHVLDSMEARFVRATGSLAEKLMFALQGANIPGADSRCLSDGISSKSSYLRVARPADPEGDFFIDLIVRSTDAGVDPIDSLQALFDAQIILDVDEKEIARQVTLFPNPARDRLVLSCSESLWQPGLKLRLMDSRGVVVMERPLLHSRSEIELDTNLSKGAYFYQLFTNAGDVLNVGRFVIY